MALFILSALGLLLLAYSGICLFYWVFQEKFIFVRFTLPERFNFNFAQPFEELRMERPDGAVLHALHFTVPKPEGAVLYLHGNTGSLRRWGKRAPRFTTLRHAVLMPDYRGYGKSSGRLSEAALHADALAWFDRLAELYGEGNVVIYGRSLGSGMAVPIAAARSPRSLILESPYASFLDVARHYLAILPYRWLLKYRFRSDVAIKGVKCPVFIFHGKRDPLVPYSSALRLYASIPVEVHRELVTFSKGYHSDLAGYPRFRKKLRTILTMDRGPAPAR
ncbi:MAG: alpha/beta hydrolase [Flavobacteriales bacterium]|nr:alpha/beta hydrolase [Flavobacteriales bacterium]MBK6894278.1 alpha/beta hydrolase [Flavobacteriales bacterium]MBK7248208.1 alpha/beta hydrolase [Flavobacteriales bacterium]MBK7287442.1 alpha/beta hydrolase [Flavobacteriales bacterium]MBK9598037.1 alpha/beta hydrolase [Flavobacteriales bacterium]